MGTLSITTSALTHSLAWALLHSLWQGLLVYALLFVLLKALPNASARVKYYLSYSAFTALLVWFADTWYTQFQHLRITAIYLPQVKMDSIAPVIYSEKPHPIYESHTPLVTHFTPNIDRYFPAIITFYTIGLVFMMFRFLVNIIQLKSLRTQGISLPEPKWNSLLQKLQQQFEITRTVQLFLSTRINVPMMLGTLKPVILLPVATINHLTTEQVEAILLHELAHIKRHDYLLNIIQTIAETILFFNPFIWLISRTIRRERENCCDDLVVANTTNPLPYANALAILETSRNEAGSLSLAATGNKKQLLNRIKRIMEMKKSGLNYNQLTLIIIAVLAVTITVSVFTSTTSFAQKAKGNKGDTTTKNSSIKNKTVTVDSNENSTAEKQAPGTSLNDKSRNNNDIKVTPEDSTAAALKFKNPGYSEDTAIIRFIMKNGTTVCARLSDNPLDGKVIIKALNYVNKGEAINWDEMKLDLQQLITRAYQPINDPRLPGDIEDAINKEIDQQKKFRENYVSIIDSIYVTFEMKDGSKYFFNLYSNPLLTHKIFKGMSIRRIGIDYNRNGGKIDWDELRSNFEHSITEAYKNIINPQLQQEIETKIDEEIAKAKKNEELRNDMYTSQKALIQELTKDMLIDTATNYKIYYNNDSLCINGVTQSRSIVDKYCKQLNKTYSFTISNCPHNH